MKTILYPLLSILAFSVLTACGSTTTADRANNFAATPTGRVLTNVLITAAVSAGEQYAAGRNVDAHQLVADTLDGAAQGLRSLAGTPRAGSPQAIASATTTGAGIRAFDNTVAPIAAATISKQIEEGARPDQAIENMATTMNKAAARTRQLKAAAGP